MFGKKTNFNRYELKCDPIFFINNLKNKTNLISPLVALNHFIQY